MSTHATTQEAELFAACAAFLAADQVLRDWDDDVIELDEDASQAAVRALYAALKIVTGIRATTPAAIHAKLGVALFAMRSLAKGEFYSEDAAAAVLDAIADALALPEGAAARKPPVFEG